MGYYRNEDNYIDLRDQEKTSEAIRVGVTINSPSLDDAHTTHT